MGHEERNLEIYGCGKCAGPNGLVRGETTSTSRERGDAHRSAGEGRGSSTKIVCQGQEGRSQFNRNTPLVSLPRTLQHVLNIVADNMPDPGSEGCCSIPAEPQPQK